MRKRFVVGGIVLVLALGGGGIMMAQSKGKAAKKEDTAKVTRGELKVVVAETGTVQPLTKVDIKSKVAGQVSRLHVEVGDRVEKGQVLIELDTLEFRRALDRVEADRDMVKARLDMLLAGPRREEIAEAEAQLDQAQAQFERAEVDYKRSQQALKTGTITPREAETAQSEYLAAKASMAAMRQRVLRLRAGARPQEIAEARAQLKRAEVALSETRDQLSYATIRAPMAGTVIKRGIEVGEMVSPGVSATAQGTSMLTIADLDRLVITSNFNQIDIGKVKRAQTVEVRVDSAPGKVFVGSVRKVAPAAEQQKDQSAQTFPVETILDGKGAHALKPGMSADLDIHVAAKADALYLPVEAVIRGKGDEATVTLPAKGDAKSEQKKVRIGLTNDHQIEILDGLKQDQEVLIKPASSADNAVKF